MGATNLFDPFVQTNKLTLEYERLNDLWQTYDFVESLTKLKTIQDKNFEFATKMILITKSMQIEIKKAFIKPPFDREKIYLILSDLLKVALMNISIYEDDKST